MEALFSEAQPLYSHAAFGLEECAFAFRSDQEVSGQWVEIKFNGITIRQSNFTIGRPVRFKVETLEPVIEMHFSLNGCAEVSNHQQKEKVSIGGMQHNIVGIPSFTGEYAFTQTAQPVNSIEIILTRNFFNGWINEDCRLQCRLLENLDKGMMSLADRRHLHITPQMQLLLSDIAQSRREGYLKKMYLEARVLELLMLQTEAFEADNRYQLAPKDYDSIRQVKELIDRDPDTPHTLHSLAKNAGTNTFKLKKGFKELFGQTVFDYIRNLKLEKARQLLLDGGLNVSEAAYLLNYNSPNNFITAFKKKYGISPGRLSRK